MNEQTQMLDEEQARNLTLAVYILQAAGFFVGGITWVAGVIINHIKQDSVQGTWYASHFRWQMRTFWFALLWLAVATPLIFVMIGFLGYAAVCIWVIYRIIRGWLNFNERRPMYELS
ncbi:hypothetical protein QP938_12855 [Porticoccaceae bacterium LTM1]|nr:hypothetical protein QP938_12855 [Porticoccaceae bacterium LTM1]